MGKLHRDKKTKRIKENALNKNSLGSASKRPSTKRRKTKKGLYCACMHKKCLRLCTKNVYIVFLLSMEGLLEAVF
jgi:hypothetical protein